MSLVTKKEKRVTRIYRYFKEKLQTTQIVLNHNVIDEYTKVYKDGIHPSILDDLFKGEIWLCEEERAI